MLRGLLAACLGMVLGVAISVGSPLLAQKQTADDSLPWQEARLLAEVLERVKRDYVDSIDDEALIESAIRGMITELDPHSAFLDAGEYRDVRISTSGTYSGIGLEVVAEEDRVVVVTPIDGAPAARAGIRPNDIIFSIDGFAVSAADLADTVARMRGDAGSAVVLGIRRPGEETPLSFELTRSRVEVQSVRAEWLESPAGGEAYAYARISLFTDGTARELYAALEGLRQESGTGPAGLVLDLRNNPGGVLDAAAEVADAFLESGVIVSADGRMPDARFRIEATPGDLLAGAPIAVIVNHGSASASEIVAAALKEHGRATIVGEPTFGKGSVQTIIPLSDGGAIKLTTSRYYTPSGNSIHGSGVAPDTLVPAQTETGADPQLSSALKILDNGAGERRLELAVIGQRGD